MKGFVLLAALFSWVAANKYASTNFRKPVGCPSNGFLCTSQNTFITCFIINGHVQFSSVQGCADKRKCSEYFSVPCVSEELPEPTTTEYYPDVNPTSETTLSDNVPECHKWFTIYPGPKCNQYYICIPFLAVFWIIAVLGECPPGQAFNGRDCIQSEYCKG